MELSWTLSNPDKKWKSLCRSQRTIKDILNSNCAQITMLRRILHKIVLTITYLKLSMELELNFILALRTKTICQ